MINALNIKPMDSIMVNWKKKPKGTKQRCPLLFNSSPFSARTLDRERINTREENRRK